MTNDYLTALDRALRTLGMQTVPFRTVADPGTVPDAGVLIVLVRGGRPQDLETLRDNLRPLRPAGVQAFYTRIDNAPVSSLAGRAGNILRRLLRREPRRGLTRTRPGWRKP